MESYKLTEEYCNNIIKVFSEEEEVLAFGENYINPPKGKIYLTIREARRKINEMKLIATAKCKYTE